MTRERKGRDKEREREAETSEWQRQTKIRVGGYVRFETQDNKSNLVINLGIM